MSMKMKLILPLAILAATAAASVIIIVHSFTTSTAGNLPPGALPPGVTGTPRAAHGPATVNADAASHVLTDHVSPGESITPGTVRATLETFGTLSTDAGARSQGFRYASDYPVWVVSASGTFVPLAMSMPEGSGPQQFIQKTLYIDGYTGAVITTELVGATPTAGELAAQATARAISEKMYGTPHTPQGRTPTPAP